MCPSVSEFSIFEKWRVDVSCLYRVSVQPRLQQIVLHIFSLNSWLIFPILVCWSLAPFVDSVVSTKERPEAADISIKASSREWKNKPGPDRTNLSKTLNCPWKRPAQTGQWRGGAASGGVPLGRSEGPEWCVQTGGKCKTMSPPWTCPPLSPRLYQDNIMFTWARNAIRLGSLHNLPVWPLGSQFITAFRLKYINLYACSINA